MPFFGHVSGKTTALLVALATLVHGASTLALPMSMMSKAFQVPPPMRAPAAQELQHRTRFMSLDELFPEVAPAHPLLCCIAGVKVCCVTCHCLSMHITSMSPPVPPSVFGANLEETQPGWRTALRGMGSGFGSPQGSKSCRVSIRFPVACHFDAPPLPFSSYSSPSINTEHSFRGLEKTETQRHA